MLTINLLQALPKTPLWDRLARDGRIVDDPSLESNVRFLRPYDEVIGAVAARIAHAYDAGAAVRALPPSGRRDLRQPHQSRRRAAG